MKKWLKCGTIKKKLGKIQLKKYRRSWDLSPPKMSIESVNESLFSPLNKNIPNSKIEVIKGCSHNVHLEIPEKFNEIVKNFLES